MSEEKKEENNGLGLTAEQLAKEFKEHSVAEFFKKNKQMLGLTGKIRTLTTIVHEYCTNAIDACEEAKVLPEIEVKIAELGEEYYEVMVKDNGPGLTEQTIGKAFAQLLSGTKFHRLMQSRGQQGIGACMKADTLVPLADGRIFQIKEIVDKNMVGEEVISLDLNSMKLVPGKIVKCWKPKNPLFVKIKTAKGRVISLTPENPVLSIEDGKPVWVRADEVSNGMKIAAPNALIAFPQNKRTIDLFNENTIQVDEPELLDELLQEPLKKFKSYVRIARALGVKKDVLRNWARRKMPNNNPRGRPSLAQLLKIAKLAGMEKNELTQKIGRVGRKGTFSRIPLNIDEETAWLVGLVAGDGHLSSTKDNKWGVNIAFTNKDTELIQKYKNVIENKFEIKTQQYFNEKKKYYTVQCSSKILSEIMEFFGVTRGNKSKCFDLSNNLFLLGNEIVAAYLRGIFDAEGSVSKEKKTITLTLYNKKALEKIFFALLRLGIHANINKAGEENRITITKKSNIYSFYKKIGFSSSSKNSLLPELLQGKKTNNITDTIPNINPIVIEYMHEIKKPLSCLQSASYSALHNKTISRDSLQQLLRIVGVQNDKGVFLSKLAEADITWLKVTSVEFEKNQEELVYDLEIENYHNFVANGVICHNSGVTMLSLMTTGKPIQVISGSGKKTLMAELTIDPKKNEPKIIKMEEIKKDFNGTAVKAKFKEVKYQRSEQGAFEYLRRTAIANPHATISFIEPDGTKTVWARTSKAVPERSFEVKPHPKGTTVDEILTMAKATDARKTSSFLKNDFDRMGDKAIEEIVKQVHFDMNKDPRKLEWSEAEEIVKSIKGIQFIAPRTDALRPIGEERIKESLQEIVQPEFLSVVERKPQVYSGGFAFQVEAAVAFGGNAGRGSGEIIENPDGTKTEIKKIELMRFANRVPLLFDGGGCALTKAVQSIEWKRYGIKDLDNAPLTVFLHILSVHIPYTGAGKQAVTDDDAIMEELRLAIMDTGRKIYRFVAGKRREAEKQAKKKIFLKYATEVAIALNTLTGKPIKTIETRLHEIVFKRLKLEEKKEAKMAEEMNDAELEKEEKKAAKEKKKKKKTTFAEGNEE